LQDIDRLKESLRHLAEFLDSQSVRIKQEQDAITSLAKERSELEPILRSQREVIDEVFRIQEKRTRRLKWLDILIGIVIGVCTSFTASVLFELFRRRTQRRRADLST